MNWKRAIAVVTLIALAGCASMPKPPPGYPDNWAIIAPKLNFVLPPPSALGQTVDVAQTIVTRYRGSSFSLDVRVQISPEELDFVAMDGFGRRAVTITWKGATPVYESAAWMPPLLRPANMLADFAICYWPDEAISEAIKGAGAKLVTRNGVRTIERNGQKLVTVEYGDGEGWNRSAHLRNLAFGYEIDVQSVQNDR